MNGRPANEGDKQRHKYYPGVASGFSLFFKEKKTEIKARIESRHYAWPSSVSCY